LSVGELPVVDVNDVVNETEDEYPPEDKEMDCCEYIEKNRDVELEHGRWKDEMV